VRREAVLEIDLEAEEAAIERAAFALVEAAQDRNGFGEARRGPGVRSSIALAVFQSRWPSCAATSSSVSEWLAERPRASSPARRRRAMDFASSVDAITAIPFIRR